MSTQRQDDNNIISSGSNTGTVRSDNSVISSGGNNPVILSSSLSNDITLNGKLYQIISQIARSGEAEVFLVTDTNQKLIFKYYYSQYKPKDEILNKLKGLRHPDIIALIDFGYYQERFFEIAEYAEGGTLSDIMPVSSLSKTQEIVKETIEALNYCHNHGIIHRDIKPENIFFRTSEKKDIAIGDFGIASNIKEGEELVRTTLARTNLYAAPELFTNIQGKTTIEKSVDYYALGMTLLHLWVGKNPFEDVDEFGIMRLKSEGRVLFPDGIDSDVEKLIKGLITVNPRDRWSYNEVKSWLNGEDVRVLYQTVQLEYKPYSFGLIDGEQIVVNNPKDLAGLLEKYPEKGEGHLYRNTIAKWIEQVDQGLFNELMDIVEKEFPKDRTAGLIKAIYILDQDRPFKGADKTKLRSQEEIANYFEENFGHYQTDLKNPNAAFYIFLEARNYKPKADEYRNYFKNHNSELALNTLILTLQDSDKYIVKNYTVYQPAELLKLSDDLKPKIIQDLSNTNSKLSLWVTNFKNLESTINKWRVLKRYDQTTLRYALQEGFVFNEQIATSESEFYQLFKNNNNSFFSTSDNTALQKEANYWLSNYQNNSLTRTATNYLKTEAYSEKCFLLILNYILENYKDAKLTIYEVVEELLKIISQKTNDNPALVQRVVEICEVNIEKTWTDEQAATKQFIDCLNGYLHFAESNISEHSEFISQLTYQLDDRISNGVRNDINFCKGDEKTFNQYCADVKTCIDRLKKINPELPYVIRHQREISLIQHGQSHISRKLSDEKQSKIDITFETYKDALTKKRISDKQYSKTEFLYKTSLSFIMLFLAFIMLLLVYFKGSEVSAFKIIKTLLQVTGVLLSAYIGIFAIKSGTYAQRLFMLWWVGLLLLWLLPKFLLNVPKYLFKNLDYFNGIYSFNYSLLYKHLIIFSCLLATVSALIIIILNSARQKSTNKIALSKTEEAGLKKSLASVDQHFSKKLNFEHHDEKVRILSLEDVTFEKEYNSKQGKLENTASFSELTINKQTNFSDQLTSINSPTNNNTNIASYIAGGLLLLSLLLGVLKYTDNKSALNSNNDFNINSQPSNTQNYTSTYYTVSASQANMRQSPSKNGTLLTTIYQGTTVEVINTQNSGWYKVRYNGYEGYISSKLLNYGTNSYNNTNNTSVTPTTSTNEYVPENNSSIPEIKEKQYQWVTCPDCNGGGEVSANTTCSSCEGSGTYSCNSCSGLGKYDCNSCSGQGYYTCNSCSGVGYYNCTSCSAVGWYYCTSCSGQGSYTDYNGRRVTCTSCSGRGKHTCSSCGGRKTHTCSSCGGRKIHTCSTCGGRKNHTCTTCRGKGKTTCSSCSGTGKYTSSGTCPKCSGKGQIQQEI